MKGEGRKTVPGTVAVLLSVLLATVLTHTSSAASIDWKAAAAPGVVKIISQNEDGSMRETKIWIALVDDQAYIRTGGTRWYGNIERNPDATLRSEDAEHLVRAELISDEALAQRVVDAFREKYGFADRLAGIMRFGDTHIMRLVVR